jgi:hypothetical protein
MRGDLLLAIVILVGGNARMREGARYGLLWLEGGGLQTAMLRVGVAGSV